MNTPQETGTRPSASAVTITVWPWWQEAGKSTATPPDCKRPAAIEAFVMICAAAILRFALDLKIPAWILLGMACFVLASGLFLPPAYQAFKRLGHRAGQGFGVFLTWLLLVPFFYLCFTTGRLFLWALGKDPLHRQCPSSEKSYWTLHKQHGTTERYTKQY